MGHVTAPPTGGGVGWDRSNETPEDALLYSFDFLTI